MILSPPLPLPSFYVLHFFLLLLSFVHRLFIKHVNAAALVLLLEEEEEKGKKEKKEEGRRRNLPPPQYIILTVLVQYLTGTSALCLPQIPFRLTYLHNDIQ